jgi:hypothetical protein
MLAAISSDALITAIIWLVVGGLNKRLPDQCEQRIYHDDYHDQHEQHSGNLAERIWQADLLESPIENKINSFLMLRLALFLLLALCGCSTPKPQEVSDEELRQESERASEMRRPERP